MAMMRVMVVPYIGSYDSRVYRSRNQLAQFLPRLHTNAGQAVFLPVVPPADASQLSLNRAPPAQRSEHFCTNAHKTVARVAGLGISPGVVVFFPAIVGHPHREVARTGRTASMRSWNGP